jgi:phosphotriesterase-related protein
MTVRGEIASEELGVCYPHEHLFLDQWGSDGGPRGVYADVGLTTRELRPFVRAGGKAIVDVTAPWPAIGRNPEALLRVAEALDIHVIMATGFYLPSLSAGSTLVDRSSVDELASGLLEEIDRGWGAAGIRPGVIKVASECAYILPSEERTLRAVGRAHLQTGLPITTHAELYPGLGLKQLAILREERVEPQHVIIGHCSTVLDIEYLVAVCETGAFAAFDTVGRNDLIPDEALAGTIAQLSARGFTNRLLLSMDICRRSHLAGLGGPGWAYLLERFVPMLFEQGVTESQVREMMLENPARALSRSGGMRSPSHR